jgi:hypothetical protein
LDRLGPDINGPHQGLRQPYLQEALPVEGDPPLGLGIEAVEDKLEGVTVSICSPGLPVPHHQGPILDPIGEVRGRVDRHLLELPGGHLLNGLPTVQGQGGKLLVERKPEEVRQTADHVVPQLSPLLLPDGHRVLMLEEGRELGVLPVEPSPRLLPLAAHPAERILDELLTPEAPPLPECFQGELCRLVD